MSDNTSRLIGTVLVVALVGVLFAWCVWLQDASGDELEGDGFHALPTPAELVWAARTLAYTEWLEAATWAQAEAERIAAERAEAARRAVEPRASSTSVTRGSGACGGDLPPCYVMMRESRGNITAQNPTSSASGKWQFLDSTWANHRGYAKARYAPEWVQDEKARQLWAGGAGCRHWSACS